MKSVQDTYSKETGWYKEEVEPQLDQKVTVSFYSDRLVFDIIGISKSTKVLTLRACKPILVEKAEFAVGGFGGTVTKPAVWVTESDLNGSVVKAYWSDKASCYKLHKRYRLTLNEDAYYYDYNF